MRTAKSSDNRPESYQVDIDSINVLSRSPLATAQKWQARKDVTFPLLDPSLCHLQRTRKETKVSLGFFKPFEIVRLEIEPENNPDWTPEQRAKLQQYPLFQNTPVYPLEKIPYKFYYRFRCNEPDCKGHRLSCVDWELGQAYRTWQRKYGKGWEQKLRRKFEQEMIERYDTHFFVGTVRAHPDSWLIVGLFYPLK